MFVIEGLPTVILGIICLLIVRDRPSDASWLTAEEKRWLNNTLEAEQAQKEAVFKSSVTKTLFNSRVLALGAVYFGIVFGTYAISFWLPLVIKSFGGLDNTQVGYLASIPALCGTLALIVWSRHSDKTGERTWHAASAALLGAIGFVLSGLLLSTPHLAMIALCLASMGCFAAVSVFWTLPTGFLTGANAAAGIGLITALGNLSGYFGPQIIGLIKDGTGSFSSALMVVGAGPLMAAAIILVLGRNKDISDAAEGRFSLKPAE